MPHSRLCLFLQESTTTSTSKILAKARNAATARASALASAPSTSLRYLSNLASSSNTPLSSNDALAAANELLIHDLNQHYVTGDEAFDLLDAYNDTGSSSNAAEKHRNQVGGFVQNEVWRKAMREAIGGLWDAPLADLDDIAPEAEQVRVKLERDAVMA